MHIYLRFDFNDFKISLLLINLQMILRTQKYGKPFLDLKHVMELKTVVSLSWNNLQICYLLEDIFSPWLSLYFSMPHCYVVKLNLQ